MTTATGYATPRAAVNYLSHEKVEDALAVALGVRPGTAHQLMHGRESVFARAEIIIEVLIHAGRRARAQRLCDKLLRILAAQPPVVFCPQLIVREAQAAAEVEVARALYQAEHSTEHLARFEHAIRAHEAIERDLDTAAARQLEADA